MSKIKKSVSIVLVLLMLISALSLSSVSVYAQKRIDIGFGDWMGYENDDGTLTLTGCRNIGQYIYNQTLTLPDNVNGKKVTQLDTYNGEYSFYIFDNPQNDISEIILPDSIENVGPPVDDTGVFSAYKSLEKLTLPSNSNFNSSDAENLFGSWMSHNSLKELVCYNDEQLNGLVDSVYGKGFPSLRELTLTSLENKAVSINDGLDFYKNFPILEKINIKSASSIKLWGLDISTLNISEAQNLYSLNIASLNNLYSLNIPESVRKLELSYCEKLTEVNYSGNIKNLSVEELNECPNVNLSTIYVRYYDNSAYQCTTKLGTDYTSSLYKLSKVQEIHIDSQRLSNNKSGVHSTKKVFRQMPMLEKIIIEGSHPNYYTSNDILYFKSDNYNMLVTYPAAKSNGGNFTVPDNVTYICAYAFECSSLDTITIPENINKLFEWDYFYDEYTYNWVYFTDFFEGKIRVVKNSAAYDSFYGDNSKLDLYKGSTYTISYKLNGGVNNKTNPNNYTAGDIIQIKNPTKKGYNFLGWTRNDTTEYINTTNRIDYFKNLVFTAHWAEIKKSNPMIVTGKTVSAKSKKTTTIAKTKAFTIKKAQGTVTFKKVSGDKKITITKAGKITVKKGLKKGKTYSFKVKVTAAGNKSYKAGSKTVTVKIKVK